MSTPQSHLRLSTKSSSAVVVPRCSLNPKFPSRPPPGVRKIPPQKSSSKSDFLPRDRFIPFGRHKGQRLGTLPSSYLKWASKNLKKTQFEDWALLADQVLNDPLYGDRIEWEYVQRMMEGDFGSSRIREHMSDDIVADINEIAEKFDWDMEDHAGWSQVNLGLLGTSYGGRIPRKKDWWSRRDKFKKAAASDDDTEEEAAEAIVGERRRRRERREKRMLKSERERGLGLGELGGTTQEEEESKSDGDDQDVLGKSQYPRLENGVFPGRESFFKKVTSSRKRSS